MAPTPGHAGIVHHRLTGIVGPIILHIGETHGDTAVAEPRWKNNRGGGAGIVVLGVVGVVEGDVISPRHGGCTEVVPAVTAALEAGGPVGSDTPVFINRHRAGNGSAAVANRHQERHRLNVAVGDGRPQFGFGHGEVGRTDGGLGRGQGHALAPKKSPRSATVITRAIVGNERKPYAGDRVENGLVPGRGRYAAGTISGAEAPARVGGVVPGPAVGIIGGRSGGVAVRVVVNRDAGGLAADDLRPSRAINLKVPGTIGVLGRRILGVNRQAYAGSGKIGLGNGKAKLAAGGVPVAVTLGADQVAVDVKGRIVVAGGANLGRHEAAGRAGRLGAKRRDGQERQESKGQPAKTKIDFRRD